MNTKNIALGLPDAKAKSFPQQAHPRRGDRHKGGVNGE